MKIVSSECLLLRPASFRGVYCAGLLLLIASNVQAQNLFEAKSAGKIYEVTPGGGQNNFATGIVNPSALVFNSAGNSFVASGSSIIEIKPGGAKSTFATGVFGTEGLAFNSTGDLFATTADGTIHEFTPHGVQSNFASGLKNLGELAFDSSGDLFA